MQTIEEVRNKIAEQQMTFADALEAFAELLDDVRERLAPYDRMIEPLQKERTEIEGLMRQVAERIGENRTVGNYRLKLIKEQQEERFNPTVLKALLRELEAKNDPLALRLASAREQVVTRKGHVRLEIRRRNRE